MSGSLQPTDQAVERLTAGRQPHDPRGILNALSRIGYSMSEAVSDLLDNSIDACARTVLIRLWHDGERLSGVSIVDDGLGMSEEVLDEAMRFASQLPHKDADLGKFGLGLKSASHLAVRPGGSFDAPARNIGLVEPIPWQQEGSPGHTGAGSLPRGQPARRPPWDSFGAGVKSVAVDRLYQNLKVHCFTYLELVKFSHYLTCPVLHVL